MTAGDFLVQLDLLSVSHSAAHGVREAVCPACSGACPDRERQKLSPVSSPPPTPLRSVASAAVQLLEARLLRRSSAIGFTVASRSVCMTELSLGLATPAAGEGGAPAPSDTAARVQILDADLIDQILGEPRDVLYFRCLMYPSHRAFLESFREARGGVLGGITCYEGRKVIHWRDLPPVQERTCQLDGAAYTRAEVLGWCMNHQGSSLRWALDFWARPRDFGSPRPRTPRWPRPRACDRLEPLTEEAPVS